MDIKKKELTMISSLTLAKETQRILIVDDEIFNIEALKTILEFTFGFTRVNQVCAHAMNGEEAL